MNSSIPCKGCMHHYLSQVRFPLLLMLCPMSGAAASEMTLQAYAEESAPFHFTANGKVVGVATDVLRLACERAGIDCVVEIMPWARAYALTRRDANTLIYSMVRSPDREKDFIWLSPIASEAVWIYARPDSPPVKSLADLRDKRIGVINGSSGIAFLRDAGVPYSAVDLANSTEANFRKLAARRIDFIVSTEGRMLTELSRFKLPFNLKKSIKLQDATTYYAMNPKSDPALVRALKDALEDISSEKLIDNIKSQYQAK